MNLSEFSHLTKDSKNNQFIEKCCLFSEFSLNHGWEGG